jgi:Transglycosylase-like domain
MRRKLSGYFLLSFLSFCFFTVVFLMFAKVHASADQADLQNPINTKPVPTPTIYMGPDITIATVDETQLPSPTPTIYIAQSQTTAEATQAPTPPPAQKEIPTVTPTAIPTQTPFPTETPAPSPTIAPSPTSIPQPSSSDLETLFSQYSSTYNVSEDELKKIANCESGFNTNSNNAGLYEGMFQFSASTWESVRGRMGLDPNPDLRTDPAEAIKTAAYMLSQGEENAWPNCH